MGYDLDARWRIKIQLPMSCLLSSLLSNEATQLISWPFRKRKQTEQKQGKQHRRNLFFFFFFVNLVDFAFFWQFHPSLNPRTLGNIQICATPMLHLSAYTYKFTIVYLWLERGVFDAKVHVPASLRFSFNHDSLRLWQLAGWDMEHQK